MNQNLSRAAKAAQQKAAYEANKFFETAQSQVTGRPVTLERMVGQSAPSLPDHHEYDNLETYRADVDSRTRERMTELKVLLDKEIENAKVVRIQKEEALKRENDQKLEAKALEKKEEKKGFVASLGRAAKRVRGRIGQVGKTKHEKGRGGGG